MDVSLISNLKSQSLPRQRIIIKFNQSRWNRFKEISSTTVKSQILSAPKKYPLQRGFMVCFWCGKRYPCSVPVRLVLSAFPFLLGFFWLSWVLLLLLVSCWYRQARPCYVPVRLILFAFRSLGLLFLSEVPFPTSLATSVFARKISPRVCCWWTPVPFLSGCSCFYPSF